MKLAYSIDEAAAISSIGRTKMYEHINAGRLQARKVGRRTLILKNDLQEFLQKLERY